MSAHVYTDAYLERWADQYVEDQLHRHGVSLLQYLADPERYERLRFEPFPLLPEQEAVAERYGNAKAERVTAPVENLPRRNGTIIEPLHHLRHHRRTASAMFSKGGKS